MSQAKKALITAGLAKKVFPVADMGGVYLLRPPLDKVKCVRILCAVSGQETKHQSKGESEWPIHYQN